MPACIEQATTSDRMRRSTPHADESRIAVGNSGGAERASKYGYIRVERAPDGSVRNARGTARVHLLRANVLRHRDSDELIALGLYYVA